MICPFYYFHKPNLNYSKSPAYNLALSSCPKCLKPWRSRFPGRGTCPGPLYWRPRLAHWCWLSISQSCWSETFTPNKVSKASILATTSRHFWIRFLNQRKQFYPGFTFSSPRPVVFWYTLACHWRTELCWWTLSQAEAEDWSLSQAAWCDVWWDDH